MSSACGRVRVRIRATVIFVVIVSTIGAKRILAEPLLFGGHNISGSADRQFQTLALYVYEHGFTRFGFGYASAISWMMFLFVAVIAVINYILLRRIGQPDMRLRSLTLLSVVFFSRPFRSTTAWWSPPDAIRCWPRSRRRWCPAATSSPM